MAPSSRHSDSSDWKMKCSILCYLIRVSEKFGNTVCACDSKGKCMDLCSREKVETGRGVSEAERETETDRNYLHTYNMFKYSELMKKLTCRIPMVDLNVQNFILGLLKNTTKFLICSSPFKVLHENLS